METASLHKINEGKKHMPVKTLLVTILAIVLVAVGIYDHVNGLGFSETVNAIFTFGGLTLLAFLAFWSLLNAFTAAIEEIETQA